MIQILEQNRIYMNAICPKQRTDLLETYSDYVSLVCKMEAMLKQNSLQEFAVLSDRRIYKDGNLSNVIIRPVSNKEKEIYKNFITHNFSDLGEHNCFVCLSQMKPGATLNEMIFSFPKDYHAYNFDNKLPHRIERAITYYPEDEKINQASFIVDGKYVISFKSENYDKKIIDIVESPEFEQKIMCILDCITHLQENNENMTQQQIKTEVLASALFAPLETLILDTLSLLADETNKIIKTLVGKRSKNRYLVQAEKEKLILSATKLQDYLNIRHLIHHRQDFLGFLGKFDEEEKIKGENIWQNFLTSYDSIFNKPIKSRLESYIEASKEFLPLVMIMNPHFMARQTDESNTKFIKRLKAEQEAFPSNKLLVQLGNNYSDKKIALAKNLKKCFIGIEIIDLPNTDDENENFEKMLNNYIYRHRFMDNLQYIESTIVQYNLFAGKNSSANSAWEDLRKSRIISPKELAYWLEIKKMRNELCHNYANQELNDRMIASLPELMIKVSLLNQKINEHMPTIQLLRDKIYKITHKNGMIVEIDFAQKKVLSITNAEGKQQTPISTAHSSRKPKSYTEEYPNHTSITSAGTNIVAYSLNNGIEVDVEKRRIQYSDGTKIYYTSQDRHFYIVSPHGEKIITDIYFNVLKYIHQGTEINIKKSERCQFKNRRQIIIDETARISQDFWINNKNQKMQTIYQKTDTGIILCFPDSTQIIIDRQSIRTFHKGIELTYETKNSFAQSYQPTGLTPPSKGRE